MFYENWDEKFIFLDDKIPESNTYLGEISIKTITTMQASWGGIKSGRDASHSWMHPGHVLRFYENGIKTVEIGEARAASWDARNRTSRNLNILTWIPTLLRSHSGFMYNYTLLRMSLL